MAEEDGAWALVIYFLALLGALFYLSTCLTETRATNNHRFQETGNYIINPDEDPDLIATTIAIKRGFQRGLGGCILINTSNQKTLAIEFYGPHGRNGGVDLEFVQSPTLKRAKIFLRGESFDLVQLRPNVFEALKGKLLRTCHSKNLTDVASGCLIYEGYLP